MKYYAVREGRKPGVYATWPECEAQVKGYSGAVYKSFKSKSEADAFVSGEEAGGTDDTAQEGRGAGQEKDKWDEIIDGMDPGSGYAFVDGSYNPDTGIYGYGGFLAVKSTDGDNQRFELLGSGSDPEMAAMRNISGEIGGATAAVKKAMELGLRHLTIFYDNAGIYEWTPRGTWKRNKTGTKAYHEFMKDAMEKMFINFVHTKAHTGIPGNEEADRLAKKAVGLL